MDEESSNTSMEPNEEGKLYEYNHFKNRSICKLKTKLKCNLDKRGEAIQNCIDAAVCEIIHKGTISIILNPPLFCVAPIKYKAFIKMCEVIDNWEGVVIPQCNESKKEFNRYWRTADNWWNRQKGKWYGDLFFYHILKDGSLSLFCQQLLHGERDTNAYWTLYFIFLYEMLKATVQFTKSKPNPVVFDLSFKSQKLKQLFITIGEQNGHKWDISDKSQEQSNTKYAQQWCKKIRDEKYEIYCEYYQQNNNINSINNNNILLEPPRPLSPSQRTQSTYNISNNRGNCCNNNPPIRPRKRPTFYVIQMKEHDAFLPEQLIETLYRNDSIATIHFSQNGLLNPIYRNQQQSCAVSYPYNGTHSSSWNIQNNLQSTYNPMYNPHVQYHNNYMTEECNSIQPISHQQPFINNQINYESNITNNNDNNNCNVTEYMYY